MTSLTDNALVWIIIVLALLLVSAMAITAIRLFKGPSVADRMIAMDVLIITGVATIGVAAAAFDQVVLLDVAVTVSLVTFIGTVGVAWYLQQKVAQ
jgi:multicomponent Na+:H+ antiporter subunit F